jgi:hypothetical protein
VATVECLQTLFELQKGRKDTTIKVGLLVTRSIQAAVDKELWGLGNGELWGLGNGHLCMPLDEFSRCPWKR